MGKGEKFTDKFIKSLKPAEKEYWTREGLGFCVRVYPTGEKAWYYIFTFESRKRYMHLGEGSYPDVSLETARKAFDVAKVKVANGIDPIAEKEMATQELHLSPTVATLADEYIEKWAKPNKKSWAQDKRTLDVEIIPKWGKRKAKDVRRREVVLLLEGIAKRAPVMANRTRALLSKLFNFAIEREIVEVNPCTGVKPLIKEKPVDRNLTEGEITDVWKALSTPGLLHMSLETSRCLRLVLLTGQRPGEVVAMHTSEIDGQWWTLPDPKNGIAHRVFLTDTALDLIGEKTGFIFESPRTEKETGEAKPIHVNALAHAVRKNLDGPSCNLTMEPWTPHDLRRTAATKLSELGFLDEVIDVVQNHKKKGMVGTYNRNRYDREKQQACEVWERKLLAITTGAMGKVLPMKRNQAGAE